MSSLHQDQTEILKERLKVLLDDYKTVNKRLDSELSELNRNRLKRQSETLEQELQQVESQLKALQAGQTIQPPPSPPVSAKSHLAQLANHFKATPNSHRDLKNRETMLKLVEIFWVKGVLECSLHDQVLIELGLEKQPQAVDHPWEMVLQSPGQPDQTIPSGTTMLELFTDMQHSLLILGAPGSGKTTMLLELAREAINQALTDHNQPIPVVFNLSSWAEKQPPLSEWLVDELRSKYNIPPKIAQPWVEQDQLFPLLDGLDEVALNQRNACLEAINAYREDHLVPLVVCSRVGDYGALTGKLKLHGAVLLHPLPLEQVESYFETLGPDYQAVRNVIQQDTAFQEMLQSPLMVSIVALTYQGTSVEQMQSSNSIETWRQHIFDTYMQRMFERKGINHKYTPQQTVKWLTWLAQRMNERKQSAFQIEGLQSDWLSTDWQQKLYKLIFGLIGGLIVGLVNGLIVGVIFGLIFGLVIGLENIKPVDDLKWSTKKGLVNGSIGGLISGLINGLIFGLSGELILGLSVGLIFGLIFGLEPVQVDLRIKPNQGIKQSLKTGLSVGSISGLGVGLSVGLISGLMGGLGDGLFNGLGIGLIFGLGGGLFFGGVAVLKHYTLRFILGRSGQLPYKLVPFLDDCAERIFLRNVGGGYIFIHRLLLEHFAKTMDN